MGRGTSQLVDNVNDAREVRLASVTDILFCERMKIRLGEWLDGLLQSGNRGSLIEENTNRSKQQLKTIFYKKRPALCLDGFAAHQLNLIQLVLKRHHEDLVYFSTRDESTESKSDKESLMKELTDECHEAEKMKIRNAVGFRHVIDLLSSMQKLIVGHNCFLDIAHIYSKFLGPLPQSAKEFVSFINNFFPHIIDTKILLNADDVLLQRMRRSSTSLSSAYNLLCRQLVTGSHKTGDSSLHSHVNVEVQVDDTRSSNWSSGVKHEAGYDAFMTGCIFAQSCNHLGVDFKLHSSSDNLAFNEKLKKHINLLYISWTNGDIVDLRTRSSSPTVESSGSKKTKWHPEILFQNIVLIRQFPSTLKAREIRECISKVFGPNSVTSVYHLDETAVFVQFSKQDLVSEFLVLKEHLDNSNDCISVLHPLSKLLEGGNTRAADYETYKEICSSPISKVLFADQVEAMGIRWKTKLVDGEDKTTTSSVSVGKFTTEKKHLTSNLSTCESLNDNLVETVCSA